MPDFKKDLNLSLEKEKQTMILEKEKQTMINLFIDTMPGLKKNLNLVKLSDNLGLIDDIKFWKNLCPDSAISSFTVGNDLTNPSNEPKNAIYQSLLREEGYFQTNRLLPQAMLDEMLDCIERVRAAGFPAMFALVYDVFYRAFDYFDPIMKHLLGEGYLMIPNFWVYYIETSNEAKGFEPHRDLEYLDTIDPDGNPRVLTLWITVTDATPLNSCMYVVPSKRDPQYSEAIHNLKAGGDKFRLEDVRAIPAEAGTLSCWDQYLFHWGSRGSARAAAPRVSYALYCQRGDVPPFDDAFIDLKKGVSFEERLALVCRGVYRYSYVNTDSTVQDYPALYAFLRDKMKPLLNA